MNEQQMMKDAMAQAQPLLEDFFARIPEDQQRFESIDVDQDMPGFVIDQGEYYIACVVEEVRSIVKGRKAVFWQPQAAVITGGSGGPAGDPPDYQEQDIGAPQKCVTDALIVLMETDLTLNLKYLAEHSRNAVNNKTPA